MFEKTHRFLSLDIEPESLATSPCKISRRDKARARAARRAEERENKENVDEEGQWSSPRKRARARALAEANANNGPAEQDEKPGPAESFGKLLQPVVPVVGVAPEPSTEKEVSSAKPTVKEECCDPCENKAAWSQPRRLSSKEEEIMEVDEIMLPSNEKDLELRDSKAQNCDVLVVESEAPLDQKLDVAELELPRVEED